MGLRTMTMCTEKDEWGNTFAHVVNGIKFFAMGANTTYRKNTFWENRF